jgi:hypothetical protein
MKKLAKITFILFIITIFQVSSSFAVEKNQKDASSEMNSGRMLGIHSYNLKDGVTPAEFEKFIVEEFNPVMRGLFPGIEVKFMKGEKGPKVGNYILVYDIQSQFVRNFYWPQQGGKTDASNKITDSCGEKCDKVWTRFQELVERAGWADYIEVNKNNVDNL